MSFLQPFLLVALPLIGLPILIHLINQRRFQTVRWAAMMFLLAANRMSRGYARLRQYLILAMRMLALAGLIFAISRPLAGGWVGRAGGGRPETTIVLVDRSPSLAQKGDGDGGSKLETGRRQLASALKTIGSARWVLIEGGTNAAREIDSIDVLASSPAVEGVASPSDLPAMLGSARDYIRSNKPGRTEVWVLSDLRENDWNAESGRWQALRESFREFPQAVRFHLLAYPQAAPGNLSVRVTEAKRQKAGDASELLVSLSLKREGPEDPSFRATVPIQFEIGGARTEVPVEIAGNRAEVKEHRIPLGSNLDRGWGKVSIPADTNPADNEFFFTFAKPEPRLAVIVAEDPATALPIRLAASISPDPGVPESAEVVAPDGLATVDWDRVALLVWQAPLPEGDSAKRVEALADRGGSVLFLPPKSPNPARFAGISWTSWSDLKPEGTVESWRGDAGLLANTQSGAALPVGSLKVRRACGISGERTPRATLRGGAPLLASSASRRGVWFLATNPGPDSSSMATEGVVLYVLLQRAMASGAASLGPTRQVSAGEPIVGEDPASWKRLAGPADGLSTDSPILPGVYQSGDRLLAINRPEAEDSAAVLADGKVEALFRGLDFSRVDDRAGSLGSLIQEVWRLFLAAMIVAMLAEAALCLPKAPKPATTGLMPPPPRLAEAAS